MDPLMGAAIAVAVAWISILVLVHLPWRPPVQGLRRAGGAALALVGLMVWGAPVPPWLPVAVLVVGIGWASLRARAASPVVPA